MKKLFLLIIMFYYSFSAFAQGDAFYVTTTQGGVVYRYNRNADRTEAYAEVMKTSADKTDAVTISRTIYPFGGTFSYIVDAIVSSFESRAISIRIPSSVIWLANERHVNVFTNCPYLEAIYVDEDHEYLSAKGGILYDKDKTKLICIPTFDKSDLKYISDIIPSSVTEFATSVFMNSSKAFPADFIPNNITKIGDESFKNCKNLTSIIIPNSVVSIGKSAFENCSKLTSIIIPDSVTSIENNTFYGCVNLKSVIIGENVIEIGTNAFAECDRLTSVRIGKNVTDIESGAFSCHGIDTVICFATMPPKFHCSYQYCSLFDGWTYSDGLLLVPKGSLKAYKDNSTWGKFKNIQEMKEKYTIATSVNDETMGTVSEGGVYEEDSEITLMATANEGYCFMQWSDGNTENPRTITVTKDFTYIANFAKTFIVSTSVNDEKMGKVLGAGEYGEGSKVTLTAEANKGYHFVKWSDGNTENPRTIVVTEDVNLMAMFELEGTPVNNVEESFVQVYVRDGEIYVEGINEDYQIFDAFGRLVYIGRESALSLPCGVYVVVIGNEVQKIVL